MRYSLLVVLAFVATAVAADTIHFTDGTRAMGKVTFCDEEMCVFEKRHIDRTQIAVIVFRPDVELPFAVRGMVLNDGSVDGRSFTGLTMGYIEIGSDEIDREDVAAIILRPLTKPAEPEQPSSYLRPTPPAPSAERSASPPAAVSPDPASPNPGATPTPPPAVPHCDPQFTVAPGTGEVWTGTARAREKFGHWEANADFKVELRTQCVWPLVDNSVSPPKQIGTAVLLLGTVTEHESYFESGASCVCEGENTYTSSTNFALIWRRTSDGDTTPVLSFNLPSHRRPVYVMSLGGEGHYRAPCRPVGRSGCSAVMSGSMLLVSAGKRPGAQLSWDPEERTVEGGIMRGSYAKEALGMDFAWSVCRAGVQCPPPPDFPRRTSTTDSAAGEVPEREGEDHCANLARLIDAMRALREAYDMHEDSFVEAERNRDDARDAIWGFSGTLAQYFVSLGSFAAEALTGTIGDVIGLIGSGLGLAQDLSGDNVAQAVLGMTDTDIAFSAAEEAGVRDAIRKADSVLAQEGTDSAALRTYAVEIGRSDAARAKGQNIVKGLSIVVSGADYLEKTNGLAETIQTYLDYRQEANEHRRSMEETQELMRDRQMEIEETRARLDGPCPGIPSTGAARREAGSPYRLIQSGPSAGAVPATAPEELRTIAARAAEIEARMESAVPWLLPFFARMTNEATPRLLAALLREAEPHLRAAKLDAEAAVEAGRALERQLGTNGSPGPTSE